MIWLGRGLRACWWRGSGCAGGRFGSWRKCWVEHFHIALLAEVGEPGVEEHVDLLLQQDLLDAGGNLIERRHGFTGLVLRQQSVVIVGFNLLLSDLDSLAEALLDEAEDFKPVAKIGLNARGGEAVCGEKLLPSLIGGTVLMDAGRELLAQFGDTRVDLFRSGLDGLEVLLANLLLDESAANELLESLLRRELAAAVGLEDGKPDLVIEIARKNDLLVDHGDGAIE